MNVFFDLETSGLVRGFDQILQFGAIRTDDDLREQDRFEIRCRLMPHVIPSPDAMAVTGQSIENLTDPFRPSHYEMVRELWTRLNEWTPALFLGWNSMRFDEEFLRQAFYQTLHPPYLTVCAGNGRVDVLDLIRAVAVVRPDAISVPRAADGRPIFKLDALAPANGVAHHDAHDAMADVAAMIGVCRLVRDRAPDLWAHFLGLARKSAVRNFVSREPAFAYLRRPDDIRVVTALGPSSRMPNVIYCADLSCDTGVLAQLANSDAAAPIGARGEPFVRLKTNAAPPLLPLRDAPAHLLHGLSLADLNLKTCELHRDEALVRKLLACAERSEPLRPNSPYIEEQLYEGGFWGDADRDLLRRFHNVPWRDRVDLACQFTDPRLRRLGLRLIYFEHPELIDEAVRTKADKAMAKRLLGLTGGDQPWLTVPDAMLALKHCSDDAPGIETGLGDFRRYLFERLSISAAALDAASFASNSTIHSREATSC